MKALKLKLFATRNLIGQKRS